MEALFNILIVDDTPENTPRPYSRMGFVRNVWRNCMQSSTGIKKDRGVEKNERNRRRSYQT